jgi:hypothetical protein
MTKENEMDKSAVGFEYEWLSAGELRLRFLDSKGQILGQQVVSEEGLGPLQMLVGFAFVARRCPDLDVLLKACGRMGLAVDLALMESVMEAVRVRATLSPDGGVDLEAVEGEEGSLPWACRLGRKSL